MSPGGPGTPQHTLSAADAALLEAFARMQGLTGGDLADLAMTALASQLRLQIPHCARCPLVNTAQPAPNVIEAKFR